MSHWKSSGTRAVSKILIRRQLKCSRDSTHTIGYCHNCGVHK